jgi:hypothetical protein
MTYTNVKNLQWDRDRLMVNCVVDFVHLGELPFSASPQDSAEHGREIYARCVAGDFGPIADYVPKPDEGPQEPSEIPPEFRILSTTPGAIL